MIDVIRASRPGPAGSSTRERPSTSSPTSIVVKVGDEYVIQLNDDGMPRLRISRAYRTHAAER